MWLFSSSTNSASIWTKNLLKVGMNCQQFYKILRMITYESNPKQLPIFVLIKSKAAFHKCTPTYGLQLSLRDSATGVFLWILWNFLEHLFKKTPAGDWFCKAKRKNHMRNYFQWISGFTRTHLRHQEYITI